MENVTTEVMIEPLQITTKDGEYYIHLAYWRPPLHNGRNIDIDESFSFVDFEFINVDKQIYPIRLKIKLTDDIQIVSIKLPHNWNYLHNKPGPGILYFGFTSFKHVILSQNGHQMEHE